MEFLQELKSPLFSQKQINVFVLRLDLIHPTIGGNKYFKLKYNLEQAALEGKKTILSFGGAFSNHIASLAAAGQQFGFNTIGVIRGDELNEDSNSTLRLAKQNGMQFYFVSREEYRSRNEISYIEKLKNQFGNFYLVPEGGSNALAVKGCVEIKNYIAVNFDTIMCACGTGGTIAGISVSLNQNQKAIGIPTLNDANFLENDIKQLQQSYFALSDIGNEIKAPKLIYDYHFGAYAKTTPELLNFKQDFEKDFGIPLDKIYTAKLMYAFFDLVKKNHFDLNSTAILVHTGGLQGE